MSVFNKSNRPHAQAGIAIGPILFVVAILGILATAIAAGSGSFSASTDSEAAGTKAAALIQIGQNLKIGADRLMGNGNSVSAIVADPAQTSNAVDLFSPSGGGVSAPSVTLASAPTTDVWYYTDKAIGGLGTTSTELVAFLHITPAVCDQVNNKANAITATQGNTSYQEDIGAINTATAGGNWPTALNGKMTGCVWGANGNYYYYQVLGIQ